MGNAWIVSAARTPLVTLKSPKAFGRDVEVADTTIGWRFVNPATLARELARRELRYGLATMCIGVGQGLAVVLERAA